MHRIITFSLLSIGACTIGACGCTRRDATNGPASAPATVTAFVAASTQDAVNDVAATFTRDTGITVKISPGASNTLANQIVNGAEADIFLSANELWADSVKEKGFAAETRPLLGNSLVLVVPKGNPAGIKRPEDLLAAKVDHVALAGENVPAGIYAKQALGAQHVYDDLTRDRKIVRGKDVRATLNLVELGEVTAGVVYSTDAAASDRVEVVYTFDEKSHDPIRYPLVLLKHGQQNPAARKWFDFLGSTVAAKIFEKFGFRMLK
jgi:molybdate transport system substrate-binding protein